MENLKELLPVVAWLSRKYTGGISTSVTYEQAQELMEAVLYCIKTYENEQAAGCALITLEGDSPQELYERGYELVVRKVKKMRAFYHQILKDFCSYGLKCYEDVIYQGMPAFFLHYDARFAPFNTILTLDYPVMWPMEGLCGIDAIEQYLSGVALEQKFLKAFAQDYVKQVLEAYDWNYKEQFFNLCEVLVKHLLICVMEGKSAVSEPNPVNFRKYEQWMMEQNRQTCKERFRKILKPLVDEHFHKNELLLEYLLQCV